MNNMERVIQLIAPIIVDFETVFSALEEDKISEGLTYEDITVDDVVIYLINGANRIESEDRCRGLSGPGGRGLAVAGLMNDSDYDKIERLLDKWCELQFVGRK